MLIAGHEKGQSWVRFAHSARLRAPPTLGQIRHATIKTNDYYPLIARAVERLEGAPGKLAGRFTSGAQSRRGIALQPVRALGRGISPEDASP